MLSWSTVLKSRSPLNGIDRRGRMLNPSSWFRMSVSRQSLGTGSKGKLQSLGRWTRSHVFCVLSSTVKRSDGNGPSDGRARPNNGVTASARRSCRPSSLLFASAVAALIVDARSATKPTTVGVFRLIMFQPPSLFRVVVPRAVAQRQRKRCDEKLAPGALQMAYGRNCDVGRAVDVRGALAQHAPGLCLGDQPLRVLG